MKCQRCNNPATLHITEVYDDDRWEDFHLCEQCASKHLSEAPSKAASSSVKASLSEHLGDLEESGLLIQAECTYCGLSFSDFRNTGRLGCPNDYDVFREELLPLLESIHGETRHVGKMPRRLPQTKQTQSELMQLRNRLQRAISEEDYEEAAKLRDRIQELESLG